MDTSALVCYSTYKSSEVQKGICSGFSSEKETWSIEFMIVAVFYVSPKATSPEALTLFASFHRLCVFEKLKTLKNINPRASSFHPVELRKQLCLVGAGDGSSISGGGCPGVFAMSRSLPTLQPVDVYGCTRGLCWKGYYAYSYWLVMPVVHHQEDDAPMKSISVTLANVRWSWCTGSPTSRLAVSAQSTDHERNADSVPHWHLT